MILKASLAFAKSNINKYKISILHLVSVFVLLNYGSALGQTSGVYLVNEITRVPINKAVIKNSELTFSAVSDENGFVNLNRLPKENTFVTVSAIGYESKNISTVSNDLSSFPVILLSEKTSNLEEVVVVAQSANDGLSTLNALDIHLRPIENSQGVLRMVPGLFIGQHAGGGKAEQIFLRGFDIDHGTDINITVDGIPVNMVSHAHGQGYADLHFVIPELIQKVNFDKGPYNAEKGNFTTAGYVELETKDYLDRNFIKTEVGQFNTFRGVTGINLIKSKGEKRNQNLYFAGEASYTKGYFESPQNFNRFNGVLKYHGKLNSNNNFTASITAFSSEWDASGQIPLRAIEDGSIGFYGAIDNTEGGKTSRYNANLELLSRLNNGGTFRNQIYYSKYYFELYSNFTFFKEDSINGDQIRQKESRDIVGYNSIYKKTSNLGKFKVETKTGVQLRLDLVDNIELTRTKNRTETITPIMLGNVLEFNTGVYYSSKISFTQKFDITTAIRFDYFQNQYEDLLLNETNSSKTTFFSPKLNFNYSVNKNIQIYQYNGRGFHSNDTRVAVQENGRKVLPPAYGSDLGGMFKIGKKVFLQTAIWYLWLDQEFVYVGDEGVVEAGGQTRRFGLDVSIRYEIIRNLYADLDLNITNPKGLNVPKNESYIALAPVFTSIGGLTYKTDKGLNGSLRYRYMGNRAANESNSVIAKGYFIMDAAINYTAKKWQAGLSIQNILNTKWKETQFNTESRLQNESEPVSEIHFTPGTPFNARLNFTYFL